MTFSFKIGQLFFLSSSPRITMPMGWTCLHLISCGRTSPKAMCVGLTSLAASSAGGWRNVRDVCVRGGSRTENKRRTTVAFLLCKFSYCFTQQNRKHSPCKLTHIALFQSDSLSQAFKRGWSLPQGLHTGVLIFQWKLADFQPVFKDFRACVAHLMQCSLTTGLLWKRPYEKVEWY